jgi:4'-phosphopantetheinyl transferase
MMQAAARDEDLGKPALSLPGDELHVWRASLDQPPQVVARLERLLSAPEREHADRFAFEQLRARYVVGRGLLRTLLGRYAEVPSREIEFSYGEHGKPFVSGRFPWFNLSHSGPVVLFAFSSSAEVGIDVELEDRAHASMSIAERFFSPAEARSLRSLPEALQPRAFLTCWTRKEAFIKARGDGLSLPLRSFDVTLEPSQPAAVLRTAWSESEPAEWSLVDLSDPEGRIVAAAAGRHPGWRVVSRRIADDLTRCHAR